MKKLVLVVAILLLGVPVQAEIQRAPGLGEFKANIKPEITQVNVNDFQFLANYFHSGPRGAPPFDWCWSQRVLGWADQIRIRGDWVFCGRQNWMMPDPFNTQIGPDYYVIAGIIRTARGDMYTMTFRSAAWDEQTLEGYGGLTRIFGGSGDFNYALGWTTDRPKEYPPSSGTRSQGAIDVLGAGSDDHDSGTRLEFPTRVPGNIEVFDDWDYFIFDTKAGWRYNFYTTLGTLDDSLVALDNPIAGPPECYFGQWREDDGLWDGEGSELGAFTAPADCTYGLWVLDWGRAGTSGTGTYTVIGVEYLP